MADTTDVTVDNHGVVDMDTLTKRAETLIQAYEAICKANKTIMENCIGKCRSCPIAKICDNEWIIYDEPEFKEVEPWADFIDRADRHEEKLAEQNEENVAWYEYLD